jgi:hypothetical protein
MESLWEQTLYHLEHGNFTKLQSALGGPAAFDHFILGAVENGSFAGDPDALAEALTCACMLGRTEVARKLLQRGVEPYAGMKTGLAGPHYAASGAKVDLVQMLIDLGVPLEVKNIYGGTMLGQALWSAINEPVDTHAETIEMLVGAGASVHPGTLEWWNTQSVPNAETQRRVAAVLSGS